MSRYEHGRILAVNETKLGSELVAAHAAGVLSLTVEDPVDFDEDGGHLLIADQVIEYETYDDDTGEITLLSALDGSAGDGERVWLYDPLYQTVTTDLIAEVELDGDDDNTDALECSIAHHLVDKVSEGIRGLRGESVRLEQDGDEWIIVDILGLGDKNATGTQFWQDPHTVATVGAQSIALTHEPITNSEHLYWNGLYQPASEWSRNELAVTVPDGANVLSVGDELTVEYAYRAGPVDPFPNMVGSGSAFSSSTTTSLTVPIENAEAGDLILLFAGRAADIATPAGWTAVGSIQSSVSLNQVGQVRLQVFSKVSDGTETEVTLNAGTAATMGAAALVFRSVTVVDAATGLVENVDSSYEFTAPAASGRSSVAAALYDGDGQSGSGDEVIRVAEGDPLYNLNVNGGQWSLCVTKNGAARFADGSPSPVTTGHVWLGVTIGMNKAGG